MPLISALAGHENENIENDTSMTNVVYTEAYEPAVLIPVIKELDYHMKFDMKNLVSQVKQCMLDIGIENYEYIEPVPDWQEEHLRWQASQPLIEDEPEDGEFGVGEGEDEDSGDGVPF